MAINLYDPVRKVVRATDFDSMTTTDQLLLNILLRLDLISHRLQEDMPTQTSDMASNILKDLTSL